MPRLPPKSCVCVSNVNTYGYAVQHVTAGVTAKKRVNTPLTVAPVMAVAPMYSDVPPAVLGAVRGNVVVLHVPVLAFKLSHRSAPARRGTSAV